MICMKASPTEEQLKARAKMGYYNLEVQMMRETVKIPNIEGINVVSVHTCLTDIGAARIEEERTIAILAETLKVAPNKPIVVHTCIKEDEIVNCRKQFEEVVRLLKEYPKAELIVENELPAIIKYNNVFFREGYKFENVAVVKYIRNILGFNRIYTCLDVCHARGAINFMKNNKMLSSNLTLKDYFEANGGICRILHIASVDGDGSIDSLTHALPILNNQEAYELGVLIKKYMPNVIKVVEVKEKDYIKIPNGVVTYEALLEAGIV